MLLLPVVVVSCFLLVLFFPALVDAKRLAGLGLHILVLQTSGEVFGTGWNNRGELGTNDTVNAFLPRQMVGVTSATDMCGGAQHSCVKIGDQPYCVGSGDYGQLGQGTLSSSKVVIPVAKLNAVVTTEVFCGEQSSFAISSSSSSSAGEVYAWGFNSDGQLGNGNKTNLRFPVAINSSTAFGGASIASVGAGLQHACFLTSSSSNTTTAGGKLYCSGLNSNGQLGTGSNTPTTTPLPVALPLTSSTSQTPVHYYTSVSCGRLHTCAGTSNGEVHCWGYFGDGELGSNPGGVDAYNPVLVPGVSGAWLVWASYFSSYVLVVESPEGEQQQLRAVAFGMDYYSQMATGSQSPARFNAVPFGGNATGIVELRGGYRTTCVLLVDASVQCAGTGQYGQLGQGSAGATSTYTLLPMQQLPTMAPSTAAPTNEPSTAPTTVPTALPTMSPSTASPSIRPLAPTTPTTAPTTSSSSSNSNGYVHPQLLLAAATIIYAVFVM